MNPTQKTSYVQIALILGALAAGGVMTRIVPERVPLAAYVPHLDTIPTTAVFKSASVKKTVARCVARSLGNRRRRPPPGPAWAEFRNRRSAAEVIVSNDSTGFIRTASLR